MSEDFHFSFPWYLTASIKYSQIPYSCLHFSFHLVYSYHSFVFHSTPKAQFFQLWSYCVDCLFYFLYWVHRFFMTITFTSCIIYSWLASAPFTIVWVHRLLVKNWADFYYFLIHIILHFYGNHISQNKSTQQKEVSTPIVFFYLILSKRK